MIKANIIEEELRDKLIYLARLQHHKQYVHKEQGPDYFDCAGLVHYIYKELFDIDIFEDGYGLSNTTKLMTSSYGKIILFDEYSLNKDLSIVKRGDILFFHRQSKEDNIPKEDNYYPGHCGIYLGNNKFIHCTKSKGLVYISNFEKYEYWKKVLGGSKDIILDGKIYKIKK